jgi:L-lactate dehydrogenase complex protein LldG
MSSREQILQRVQKNQPVSGTRSHEYVITPQRFDDPIQKFKDTLVAIGASVYEIDSLQDINHYIINTFPNAQKILIYLPGDVELESESSGHAYAKVGVAVLKGDFGVAENGAVWISDKNMLDRSLPFICENLIFIIHRIDVVPTLHEAYKKLESTEYHYGTFIAGPSKTADIEQSLVLGAHGPKTLTVLML